MRFMLAIAIVVPPAALLLLSPWLSGGMEGFFNPWLGGWGLPVFAVGGVLWLAGVIWMIRIFRGPSEGPSPWRYRGRR
jgi:hypothetical protein